jgi:hypothetical protein
VDADPQHRLQARGEQASGADAPERGGNSPTQSGLPRSEGGRR